MECLRCKGQSFSREFRSQTNPYWEYTAYSCVHCGDIFDPVILANRGYSRQEIYNIFNGVCSKIDLDSACCDCKKFMGCNRVKDLIAKNRPVRG